MAIQQDASYLPNDILEIILLRLPLKSLLRFKSVSRSWNTMISDPRLVRVHHQLYMYSDSQNLFLRVTREGTFSLIRLDGRKFQTEAVLEKPRRCWRKHRTWWNCVKCVGDGVVLLALGCMTYLLWNPCTGQETILEFPYRFPHIYGLCHDPINDDDFKVVVASEDSYAVFSCKNRSWMTKKECFYMSGSNSGVCQQVGLSAEGAIYWVSYCWDWSRRHTYRILCFDPRDDNFKIVQKPENVKDSVKFFLTCLKGCLCLYCNGEEAKMVQIWIKEKGGPDRNSWIVLMNIENSERRTLRHFKLLAFTENKIVVNSVWKSFLLYDASKEKYEEVEEISEHCYLYPCLGSMFSPVARENQAQEERKWLSQLEYYSSVSTSE